LYIDKKIQILAYQWIIDLVNRARLKTEHTFLWPPQPGQEAPQTDPLVGSINGAPLKRSDVWREMLRSDADDALARLVNLEVVMTMLKKLGLERLEWESADPARRSPAPPPAKPILISAEDVDRELTNDRLAYDREREERKKSGQGETSFKDYLFQHYGKSEDEYRRALEARLVLRSAIRQRVAPDDKTLQLEFALAREIYDEPQWYEVSHILIVPAGGMEKAGPGELLAALNIAEQVRKECEANPARSAFEKLVAAWSMDTAANKANGGSLGACYPDERNASFPESRLFYGEIQKQGLKPGQVASSPLKSQRGYHVLRLDQVHPARRAEFAEVRDRVERDYIQEEAKMYMDLWLRALKEQAKVKYFLTQTGNQDMPPDRFPLPEK
jgi:hypothetical protein